MKWISYVIKVIYNQFSGLRSIVIRFTFRTILLIFIVTVFSIGMNSCRHMPENISSLPTVCFQNQVLPIFQNSCAMSGCHNGSGESGLDLTSYRGIMEGIIPGNANKSSIYRAITDLWGESVMPPQQPLRATYTVADVQA